MLYIPEIWKPFEPYLDSEFPGGIHVNRALPYLTSHKFPISDAICKVVDSDGIVRTAPAATNLPVAIEYRDFIWGVPADESVRRHESLFIETFLAAAYPDVTKLNHIASLKNGQQIQIGDYLISSVDDLLVTKSINHVSMESVTLDILTARTIEYLRSKPVTLATLYGWLRSYKFFCQNFYLVEIQKEVD